MQIEALKHLKMEKSDYKKRRTKIMSENIMSGIMKAVNKNLERDIAKKLNSLCSKYYNSNKKLQEMISKEDFADVIKNVNVSFRNRNLNVSVNPKDEDAVSEQNKKKFDEFCNEFFNQSVSEYFAKN
jgi:Zn-dependent M16 (insulinase) family peptidase